MCLAKPRTSLLTLTICPLVIRVHVLNLSFNMLTSSHQSSLHPTQWHTYMHRSALTSWITTPSDTTEAEVPPYTYIYIYKYTIHTRLFSVDASYSKTTDPNTNAFTHTHTSKYPTKIFMHAPQSSPNKSVASFTIFSFPSHCSDVTDTDSFLLCLANFSHSHLLCLWIMELSLYVYNLGASYSKSNWPEWKGFTAAWNAKRK